MNLTIKVADLFCGVGGLSLGFLKAGYSIELAVDNWKQALDVYEKNFSHQVVNLDLSDPLCVVNSLLNLDLDGIIGGPPCQDFSHAGKRKEGDRADLTDSFAQIVTKVRPKFFVMENVERTLNSRAYQSARVLFKSVGYGLTEVVLDAAFCGVPQRRKRFFCIGVVDVVDGFLLSKLAANMSDSPLTVREYFGSTLKTDFYYRHPRNYSRRAIYSLDEPSATIRGVNRPIPPNYPGHDGDAADVSSARPLTTMERAQVQTFPVNFKWVGSKTSVEQMIGNAVPVNLANFVGNILKDYLYRDLST